MYNDYIVSNNINCEKFNQAKVFQKQNEKKEAKINEIRVEFQNKDCKGNSSLSDVSYGRCRVQWRFENLTKLTFNCAGMAKCRHTQVLAKQPTR